MICNNTQCANIYAQYAQNAKNARYLQKMQKNEKNEKKIKIRKNMQKICSTD